MNPPDLSPPAQYELRTGLWLDHRRAAWFSSERALAVADLHLGYSWAQRAAGLLLPLAVTDDTLPRLEALIESYQPRQVILLGDIVHRARNIPAVVAALRDLAALLKPIERVRLLAGNHDRNLGALFRDLALPYVLEAVADVGGHRLLHGDESAPPGSLRGGTGLVIIGHEHPVIHLGDGVSCSAKCPCFLASERVLVLPAFSAWAAGMNITKRQFLSPWAQDQPFQLAVTILADKLLPIPIG